MREIWFTNKDGEYVTYLVPNDVADHIDILWELVKCYGFFDEKDKEILWYPPYLYTLVCNIESLFVRFIHFIHKTFFPKDYKRVKQMCDKLMDDNEDSISFS